MVFKPPRMHCAPLRAGKAQRSEDSGTLLDWYAAVFPQVIGLCGRKKGEGGLLHRLDFETNGLVLFAKNQKSLDCLLAQQADGGFVKEYSAICQKPSGGKTAPIPPSFPPPPAFCPFENNGLVQEGFAIKSFFRPFGPGRKQVRPVIDTGCERSACYEVARDQGDCYRTEIIDISGQDSCDGGLPDWFRFTVRLRRGFRHQVRCHLAWIGYPILNDPLYGYGEETAEGFLALRAGGLFFCDPGNGRHLEYRLSTLELPANSM